MRVQPREDGFAADLNDLLTRRAQRVQERPAQADDENVLWVAEFPVGEETCAIALDTLRAAVPLRMVTPVPLSPPHVIGILRFQGQIVTALSLASLLGGRGWREDPAVLLVVDPGFGRLVALDCERIPKPVGVPHALVDEARARSAGAVCEITLPGLRQMNLLDLRRLMDRRNVEKR
ncbi:MAG TPA: chemotaxis protein CheW [Myxococcales bacterium]|nr:chemotaxis protein CheW [Myxococcales bacterium]